MLYIGHFSFTKENENMDAYIEDKEFHGYFTTVVDAENVDNALEKFRDLIHQLGNEGDIFNHIKRINS